MRTLDFALGHVDDPFFGYDRDPDTCLWFDERTGIAYETFVEHRDVTTQELDDLGLGPDGEHSK